MVKESPAKKAKRERAPARDQLPSLLAELTGAPPDLAVLAAIRAPAPSRRDDGDDDDPHAETHRAAIGQLFAEHVGKSPAIVVGNGLRVAREEAERELDIFVRVRNSGRASAAEEREQWLLNHPQHRDLEGPATDGGVWLSLFLGKERAEEALAGTKRWNDMEPGDDGDESRESVVRRLLQTEASELAPLDLLANILSHVREGAQKEDEDVRPAHVLRFAVLYGLDGVMRDVLRSRYGEAADLDANALLPLSDAPIDEGRRAYALGFFGRAHMPAYAAAAILGHENVVVAALAGSGGAWDAPLGVQRGEEEAVDEHACHALPSIVFLWVFMKNMPGMLKCLVRNCGFQFRWIEHGMDLPMVHRRIFDTAEYESCPNWTDLDMEELAWVGSRERCRLRAAAAYKKQMEMLDLLISLGFPFSMFFNCEILDGLLDREEALIKEKNLETREQGKAYMRSMTKEERRAREKLYEAACNYNSVQETGSNDEEGEAEEEEEEDGDDGEASESGTLTLGDYYRQLKSRWDGQESAQADRLPEYEALDSRWRSSRRRQDSGSEEESSDSYRDSDDGSSYGDPPGDW